MKRSPLKRKKRINSISKKRRQLSNDEYRFRQAVRERDKVCAKCGMPGQSVHHIKGRSYPSLWCDPENGLFLCELPCHAFFELHPGYADAWVRKNRPEQWDYVTKHIKNRYGNEKYEAKK